MKEEALLSKNTAPYTTSNDEILSSLLKINNFDNSIKDESLDINLSACVTISADPTIICNNSVSSDFWKVFDESAQAPESGSRSSSSAVGDINFGSLLPPPPPVDMPKVATGWGSSDLPSPIFPSPTKKKHKGRKANKQPPREKATANGNEGQLSQQTATADPPEISNSFKGNFPINVPAATATEPTTEFKFKCEHCRIVLNGLEEFTKHEATHKILIKCNECDREFANESGLKKHLKSHREDSRKDGWKKCPDCGKCLKLGSMWMHRKIHSDNKKYGCDICGQKFVQKINLTHHQRVHTAEKPYECAECPKRFQERSHLQRHQKYHAQTRPFRCEKCGKMYKTERCLKVHNLVHLEQRPFACQVCNKSFISNSKLKQHSNIHTGERPFKCNYCTRDFTNFPNWLKHTRRRHKVDHKTGELLEHLPSYCSKSGKKSAAAANNAEGKPTRKKKKADTTPTEQNKTTVTTTSQVQQQTQPPPLHPLAPQKVSHALPPVQSMKAKIKIEADLEPAEIPDNNPNFSELHSLSITSAEELIMEQALEMEEFCFYKSQLDQFSIQKEFSIKKEFENKALCSVDSSPFSSPASVELPITYNIQSLPSTTISTTAGRIITPSESIAPNAMQCIQVFKNQTLPSVDTLINACFFKSENQQM